jgi:hypothetical protein
MRIEIAAKHVARDASNLTKVEYISPFYPFDKLIMRKKTKAICNLQKHVEPTLHHQGSSAYIESFLRYSNLSYGLFFCPKNSF